ncbi:rhodanese-like domain-containing protein [Pseudoalteromonas distincta]|uniref:rhodanese-like domain-containing protein n=1 Tax=Pseudoalteromonas distincta TaxID=77608 RepID=UPI0039EC25CE
MSQTIVKGINEFAAEARSVIKNVSVEEAKSMENSSEYAFVDVREKDEINKEGIIPGAFIAPRGMLEFLIDPSSPVHNDFFNQNKTFIFYCAHGLRSLFSAKLAFDMGLTSVRNLEGGFAKWNETLKVN